ncbi:MAG TPA: hypothetical protein VFE05_17960, partial [Longimicrobiaceae bacterium]|nr:hypothetical protein [Longimicrobiaceae bacterium]
VMASRPSMPRLLARELIDHHAEHASEQITHLAATLFTRLCDLIRAGQEGGIFRRDLDPRFAALSTVSLVPYAHIARPAVGLLLGRGVDGPTDEEMRAYGRHAAEFALSALLAHRPRPEATEPANTEEEGR